eukprot:CAMPEP_0173397960 /NCGR_PEP_ID=MMETSP1356-20130122/40049_1 /TAXON_ID=77927 ORGANISM="Hemiselmis virescens, Strain PCC157" /NCGR_SAMPLE_ID=MMETSP1356 /ASSEMBLY_ACC=CAM_ASM_000847 /LENGTH=47 /DNA_ID= /DNA_START= /DNA_END= /DNA_ORIENTATION=
MAKRVIMHSKALELRDSAALRAFCPVGGKRSTSDTSSSARAFSSCDA